MLHPVVPAVVCGISAVGILITVVLLCRHLRKRKHRTCVSTCGYDAIGDCKPPSLMSVTPSTSQVSLYMLLRLQLTVLTSSLEKNRVTISYQNRFVIAISVFWFQIFQLIMETCLYNVDPP